MPTEGPVHGSQGKAWNTDQEEHAERILHVRSTRERYIYGANGAVHIRTYTEHMERVWGGEDERGEMGGGWGGGALACALACALALALGLSRACTRPRGPKDHSANSGWPAHSRLRAK